MHVPLTHRHMNPSHTHMCTSHTPLHHSYASHPSQLSTNAMQKHGRSPLESVQWRCITAWDLFRPWLRFEDWPRGPIWSAQNIWHNESHAIVTSLACVSVWSCGNTLEQNFLASVTSPSCPMKYAWNNATAEQDWGLGFSYQITHRTQHFPCRFSYSHNVLERFISTYLKGCMVRMNAVWLWRFTHAWRRFAHSRAWFGRRHWRELHSIFCARTTSRHRYRI